MTTGLSTQQRAEQAAAPPPPQAAQASESKRDGCRNCGATNCAWRIFYPSGAMDCNHCKRDR